MLYATILLTVDLRSILKLAFRAIDSNSEPQLCQNPLNSFCCPLLWLKLIWSKEMFCLRLFLINKSWLIFAKKKYIFKDLINKKLWSGTL